MKTKETKSSSAVRNNNSFFTPKNSGGFFVQQKLNVGQPGDKYEQEADRVAEQVMTKTDVAKPFFSAATPTIQNKNIAETITPLVQRAEEEEVQTKPIQFAEEEEVQAKLEVQPQEEEEEMMQMQLMEEEEEMLQTQSMEEEEILQPKNETKKSTPSTEQKLKSNRENGNSLDTETRIQMEQGFGADFSKVNIHTNSTAVQMNKELGAQAFTTGNDIYFNEGKYNPSSQTGKKLLAHELTHTVQQGSSSTQTFVQKSTANEAYELISDAASGWGTDEEGIFRAIRECSQRNQLKPRIQNILNSELSGYDLFKARLLLKYGPESNFPPGILTIWQATNGAGTNEELVYDAIRSSSNRNFLKRSTWVQRTLRGEMSGHDYAKTQLLFRYGTESSYPSYINSLWTATVGLGTNESLIYNTMLTLSPSELRELVVNTTFVDVIRDDISGSDLQRFNAMLNGTDPAIQANDATSGYGTVQIGPIATKGTDSDDASVYSPDDIAQGAVGDCYFLASLSAVAKSNPTSLRNRIRRQPDGSYDVTLFVRDGEQFRQQVVNVTAVFPQYRNGTGTNTYARGGDVNAEGTELWVRLFEKAYAKLKGSYDAIEADWARVGLEAVTGEHAENIALNGITNAQLKIRIDAAFRANKPVTATSNGKAFFNNLSWFWAFYASAHNIVGPHVYAVLSVTDSTITLRNPHGGVTAVVTLPWSFLRYFFYRVSTITLPSR